MAHSRSAIKRWRQSLERRTRNRSVKSKTRTLLTRAISLVGSEATESEEAVRAAVASLDRAAQKGVIHANAAARSKSRLLKRFNLAQAESVAAAASAPAVAPEAEAEAPAPRRRGGILPRRAASAPAETKAPTKTPAPRASRARASTAKPAETKAPAPRSRTRKTT